jgi:hypothetical protein
LGLIQRRTSEAQLRPYLKNSYVEAAFRIDSIETIDIDDMWTIPEEPASDDFHTFVPSTCATPFGADEQVLFDGRRPASALLNYWQNSPAELKHLASMALKLLGFLATSASVERALSVARSVTTDYQIAMTQGTVSAAAG